MVYAWSVFSSSIAAEFPQWSAATLSLTFTLVMAFFCIGGLVGGFLAEKVKPSVYVWTAAVLFLLGFSISSKAQSPAALYLGFGVLCGLGSGLSYNGVMSSISKWFPDNQGLISGILLMGFGLSSFIVGKLFNTMASASSWRSVFSLFGRVAAVVFVFFAFFIRKPDKRTLSVSETNDNSKDCPPLKMIIQPKFYLFFIWALLMSAAGLALVSQASGLVTASSCVSSSAVAVLVGLISVSNGIGRVLIGLLYDRKGGKKVMYLIDTMFILSAAGLFLAVRFNNVVMLVVAFLIGGSAYGGITCTNAAYISATFGQKYYPKNFAIINTNLLFASFGSTVVGALLDATSSYLSVSCMMAVLTVFGFLLTLGVWRKSGERKISM